MRSSLYIVFFLLLGLGFSAQNSMPFEARPLTEALPIAKKGTYQVILKTGMDKIEIPNETLIETEKKRKENEIVYFQYTENIKIKIYPLSLINSKDFVIPEE